MEESGWNGVIGREMLWSVDRDRILSLSLKIKAQRSPPLLFRSQVTRAHKRRLQKVQRETLLQSGTESLHFSMIIKVWLLGADGKRKED